MQVELAVCEGQRQGSKWQFFPHAPPLADSMDLSKGLKSISGAILERRVANIRISSMHGGRLRGIQQNLIGLTIEQLNDLLVHKTLRLLDLLDKKNVHGTEYRDIKLEVECIQRAIIENRRLIKSS